MACQAINGKHTTQMPSGSQTGYPRPKTEVPGLLHMLAVQERGIAPRAELERLQESLLHLIILQPLSTNRATRWTPPYELLKFLIGSQFQVESLM
jgi:hypothetical protein